MAEFSVAFLGSALLWRWASGKPNSSSRGRHGRGGGCVWSNKMRAAAACVRTYIGFFFCSRATKAF